MFARAVLPAAALFAGVCANTAHAGDGEALRSGPVLNGDWFGDDVETVGSPSNAGPYEFMLLQPAFFRITDAFVTGDQFWATDDTRGLLGLTTHFGPRDATLFGVDPVGESSWQSGTFQTLELLLAPGAYSITVTGNGAGGLPAGFYVQLEAAPVPGPAGVAVLGLAGIAAARRRR